MNVLLVIPLLLIGLLIGLLIAGGRKLIDILQSQKLEEAHRDQVERQRAQWGQPTTTSHS